MANECMFIEPNLLICPVADLSNLQLVEEFVNDFLNLMNVFSKNEFKILIDNFLKATIVDEKADHMIPVCIDHIRDKKLKSKVVLANEYFLNSLGNCFTTIELQTCSGEQKPILTSDVNQANDNRFKEDFIYSLGSICYLKDIDGQYDVNNIVSNLKYSYFNSIDVNLACSCECKEFSRNFSLVLVEKLIDYKELFKEEFKSKFSKEFVKAKDDIVCVQSAHAPIINNTIIDEYSKIPRNMKLVLDLLIRLGLYKIHFHDWETKNESTGNINKCTLHSSSRDNGDVVEGQLMLDDKAVVVHLYFPFEIGKLVILICGSVLTYRKVCDDFLL